MRSNSTTPPHGAGRPRAPTLACAPPPTNPARSIPSRSMFDWPSNMSLSGIMAIGALATLTGFATVGLVAATAGAAEPTVVEIGIDNFSFTPPELTVAPGTTVKWTNRDDIPHTVVEKSTTWRSKPLDTDDTYSHTFDTAGEFAYFCSLHPHMTGKVIVK